MKERFAARSLSRVNRSENECRHLGRCVVVTFSYTLALYLMKHLTSRESQEENVLVRHC